MSGQELAERSALPYTAAEIRSQVNLIQEVMASVMKKDTHYGIIPGTPKPSLWKPGAEKLLMTFRIPSEPIIQDLSTEDEARFRVERRGTTSSGVFVGSGIGEASSNEEKYKWRAAVHDSEFEATPEDRRRLKYYKDGTTKKQIRTNIADVRNTILKMADKRAYVALAINVTAASDIFTQDIEDLPEGMEGDEKKSEPIAKPKPKADPAAKDAKQEGEVLSFVPAAVAVKTGEGKNGTWTKYGIKSPAGDYYSTFDTKLGNIAKEAEEEGAQIELSFVVDGQYKNVVTLKKL